MNKQILKPSWSKKILCGLVMAFILILSILVLNFREITDISIFLVMSVVVVFQTFVLSAIFHSLPFLRIEVTDSEIKGLKSLMSWDRVQIPITDIDTNNINKSFQWLGYYGFKSKSGKKLLVCAFDEKQFNNLLEILKNKNVNI